MDIAEFLEAVTPTVGEPCPASKGTCGGWVDHFCGDGTGRCLDHCTCEGRLGAVDITLTLTLPAATSPHQAARRFLSRVRRAPHEGTDLVVRVHPHNDESDTTTVTVTAADQRAD